MADDGTGSRVGGETPAAPGGRSRWPLLGPAGMGGAAGVALTVVGMLLLRSSASGSSNGPSCTMERTLECMPDTAGRAIDVVLVLLVVLAVAIGAIGLGLVLLLIVWLANRNRPAPPGRGPRVLVAAAAALAAFGITAIALVFVL